VLTARDLKQFREGCGRLRRHQCARENRRETVEFGDITSTNHGEVGGSVEDDLVCCDQSTMISGLKKGSSEWREGTLQ